VQPAQLEFKALLDHKALLGLEQQDLLEFKAPLVLSAQQEQLAQVQLVLLELRVPPDLLAQQEQLAQELLVPLVLGEQLVSRVILEQLVLLA
jgi:hypothetical protein